GRSRNLRLVKGGEDGGQDHARILTRPPLPFPIVDVTEGAADRCQVLDPAATVEGLHRDIEIDGFAPVDDVLRYMGSFGHIDRPLTPMPVTLADPLAEDN